MQSRRGPEPADGDPKRRACQHLIVVPAPQTPRSEEWAWIECGRSTPCGRGEALSRPRDTRNGRRTLRSDRLGETTIRPGPPGPTRILPCNMHRGQVTGDTNASATRTTRRLDGESGRALRGRRLQRERPPPKPKRVRPTGPPITTPPPRCRRREGVLDWVRSRARRQRRDAPICWRRRPEAARVPALDLRLNLSRKKVHD